MSQEAAGVNIEPKVWPPFLDTDDLPKKKLHNVFQVDSPEQLCYIDFSVSTTGMLTGAKVGSRRHSSHSHIMSFTHALLCLVV